MKSHQKHPLSKLPIAQFESNKQKIFPDYQTHQKPPFINDKDPWKISFNDTFKLKEKKIQNAAQTQKLQQQIQYYQSQRGLIKECAKSYSIGFDEENSQMIREILGIMSEYISYIVELLEDKIKYMGKQNQTENKVDFLRKQNQKIFKAFEEKIEESQLYQQQIQCLTERNTERIQNKISDIRPVTNRQYKQKQSSNIKIKDLINSNKSQIPLSITENNNFFQFDDQSLKSSHIQYSILRPQQNINTLSQKSHIKYFQNGQSSLKQNDTVRKKNDQKLNYKKHSLEKQRSQKRKDQSKIFGRETTNEHI